jgi:hypothetical protein
VPLGLVRAGDLSTNVKMSPVPVPQSSRNRYDLACVAVAVLVLAGLFVDNAIKSSLSLDGVRHYWLDDDQMISMRYARNLAEGHGLVWNEGERVEGYTNFGWTLLMALVHLLPLPDHVMALPVRGLAFVATALSLYLVALLVHAFAPSRHRLILPVVLLAVVTCTDVTFWAASGFETPVVTVLHLCVIVGALSGVWRPLHVLIPLALIPLIRSDGLHIWFGDAILLLWMSRDRPRLLRGLALSLLPFVGHLVFRRAYYGEWLPNTYYLKVLGLDQPFVRGYRYVSSFVARYWLILIMATGTAAAAIRFDRRVVCLVTSLLPPTAYSVLVGGDTFSPFRFFGHLMPELFVLAALGALRCAERGPGQLTWLASLAIFSTPLVDPIAKIAPPSPNGDAVEQIVVAVMLKKNADPKSSVAVIPAGIVPYFSRLKALDLLGKTDRHVARLVPRPGALIGHGKFDPAYSLGQHPDYYVSCRPLAASRMKADVRDKDYVRAFLEAPEFAREYRGNPIIDSFLRQRTAVYLSAKSKDLPKRKNWKGLVLAK